MALFPHDLRASSSTTGISRRTCSALRGCGRCGHVFERPTGRCACGGSSSTENADADTPQISPSASSRTDFNGEVTFDNYEKKGTFVPGDRALLPLRTCRSPSVRRVLENSVQGLYDPTAFVYAAINYLVLTGDAARCVSRRLMRSSLLRSHRFVDESERARRIVT